MSTIGLIGSGQFGSTVARLAVAARLLGRAAVAGDLVVMTIPFTAYRAVPVVPLAGKTVIDTNNCYPQRHGHFWNWTANRPASVG